MYLVPPLIAGIHGKESGLAALGTSPGIQHSGYNEEKGFLSLVHPEKKRFPWKQSWPLLSGSVLQPYCDNSGSSCSATFPETIVLVQAISASGQNVMHTFNLAWSRGPVLL